MKIGFGFSSGPRDYDQSLTSIILYATTDNSTTADVRVIIEDEDIVERDEFLNITLNTAQPRVMVNNSTSIIIENDDGEFIVYIPNGV